MGVKVEVYLHMVPSLILRSSFVFLFLFLFFFFFFSCSSMFLYTFRRKSLIASPVVSAFLIAIFHSAGCLDPNVLTWTFRIYYYTPCTQQNVNTSTIIKIPLAVLAKPSTSILDSCHLGYGCFANLCPSSFSMPCHALKPLHRESIL